MEDERQRNERYDGFVRDALPPPELLSELLPQRRLTAPVRVGRATLRDLGA